MENETEVTESTAIVPPFHVCPACKSEVSTDGREIRKVGENRTDHFVPIAEYNETVKSFEKRIETLVEAAVEKPAVVPETHSNAGAGKKSKVKFRI